MIAKLDKYFNSLKEINGISFGYIIHHFLNAIFFIIFPRLFSPADMGVYGIYSFFYFLALSCLMLGMDNAILFEKKIINRINIFRFMFFSLCGINLLSYSILFMFYSKIVDVRIYLLLPIHVCCNIVYDLFFHLNIKTNHTKINILMQILSVFLHVTITLFFVFFIKKSIYFIIVGGILSYMICILVYIRNFIPRKMKKSRIFYHYFSVNSFKKLKLSRKYFSYISFSVSQNIIDVLIAYIPLFYIEKYFGKTSGGYYFLSMKILSLPVVCISTPVMKFFLKKQSISMSFQKKKIQKNLFFMTIVSCFIYFFLYFFEKIGMMQFFIGEQWAEIGNIYGILIVKYCIDFVIFPFAYIFILKKMFNRLVAFKVFFLIITILFFEGHNHLSAHNSLYTWIIISVIFSISFLFYIHYFLFDKKSMKFIP